MPKPLTVWITINCGKRWEYQTTWSASWNLYVGQEATVGTGHGTTDWLQIGKGVYQGCILSPCLFNFYTEFSSVQLLSRVRLFATPWIAAHQASLSIANSRSLLKLISIESVMPSKHLILCRPLLLLPSIFPSIRVFSSESALCTGGQSIRVSASAPVLPMRVQSWFSLGLTGLISLLFKRLARAFSSTTVRKHQLFSTLPSLLSSSHICTWLPVNLLKAI